MLISILMAHWHVVAALTSLLIAGLAVAAVISNFRSGNVPVAMILLLTILVTVFVDAFVVEPNWIRTERVVVHDAQLARAVAGLKIVQISDLHIRQEPGFREEELVRIVNDLHPDLLFITGDFIDEDSQYQSVMKVVGRLQATFGKYGVLGNSDPQHENFSKMLKLSGVRLLRNEHVRIDLPDGRSFRLIGVDDPSTHAANLPAAIAGVAPREPSILLAHAPNIFIEAVQYKVNLVLVGHTHGGQIGIPFLLRKSEYADRSLALQGTVKVGSTIMHVNRGIGTKKVPARFLCRPEISVIEVTGQDAGKGDVRKRD